MSVIKKTTAIFLCISILFAFCACSGGNDNSTDKLSIICTIFPEYDWVKNIIGEGNDNIELTLLLDSGVDLHNYQPTVADLAKIYDCDIFIYVGGESDKWVSDAIANATNDKMIALNLLDTLKDSVKEEELKEGMQSEEEEGEEGEKEYDEHVWLSLKNAEMLCSAISEKLQAIDPDNADLYKSNTDAWLTSLKDLDGQYQSACDNAKTKSFVFGDRFPFRYLFDDYGLDYYAAFAGCSAETEASFETIKFLSDKVDELQLKSVIKIEGSDGKIAETIVSNTADKNQQILSLNSMQGITAKDVENGADYLSIMTENLKTLQKAMEG